jgi:hypothetical protein
MDATRLRRTRDCARQRWYAAWRCQRFARHLGFTPLAAALPVSRTPLPYDSTRDQASLALDQKGAGSWELMWCAY